MQQILEWDFIVFNFIHQTLSNGFLDVLLPILRNKYIWMPLYVFIIAFSLFNFPVKKAGLFIIGLLLTVTLADSISSHLIKKNVKRNRPCQEVLIQKEVDPLVRCGSGYSFPSSHAANHFTLAFFMIFSLPGLPKAGKWILLFWAGIISFSQIYVGVHYPLDIIGGMTVGYLVARLVAIMASHTVYRQV